jgi:hypothetical protein
MSKEGDQRISNPCETSSRHTVKRNATSSSGTQNDESADESARAFDANFDIALVALSPTMALACGVSPHAMMLLGFR